MDGSVVFAFDDLGSPVRRRRDGGTAVDFPSPEAKRKTYQEWEEKIANWITYAFTPDVIGKNTVA